MTKLQDMFGGQAAANLALNFQLQTFFSSRIFSKGMLPMMNDLDQSRVNSAESSHQSKTPMSTVA